MLAAAMKPAFRYAGFGVDGFYRTVTGQRRWKVELTCFVEVPKGSRNKYEYDERRGVIRLDRLLFWSVVFPTDYGFLRRR